MDTLSIRIKIADREYPLKIKAQEEELIRKTAKSINQKIKTFREEYGIDDKQDLLAMMIFEFMVEHNKQEAKIEELNNQLDQKLDLLKSQV